MPRDVVLLQTRSILPVVLFPYDEADTPSRTRTFLRGGAVGDIKGSLARVILELTDSEIVARGRLTSRRLLTVPLRSVVEVTQPEHLRGALLVRFEDAQWTWLTRLITSGRPRGARDRVVLNVTEPEKWGVAIRMRIA